MDRWRKVCVFCVTVRRSGYWAWIDSVNLACKALLAWSGFICTQVGPTSERCITSTIQNAFSFGMQVEHLQPLCLLGSEDGPKAGQLWFFLQATICWWPSIWQAHQGSKLVAQKYFWFDDWRQGPQFDEMENWKPFPVYGAQRLKTSRSFASPSEQKMNIIYCHSICSSWASNQPIHLWFTSTRKDHPPTTKQNKEKTLKFLHGFTWFFRLEKEKEDS